MIKLKNMSHVITVNLLVISFEVYRAYSTILLCFFKHLSSYDRGLKLKFTPGTKNVPLTTDREATAVAHTGTLSVLYLEAAVFLSAVSLFGGPKEVYSRFNNLWSKINTNISNANYEGNLHCRI